MTGTAVALAGRIGSGKTSVAVALANRLGWPRVGFGDYVRSEAVRRGLDPGVREVLQELGEELLRRDLDGFCRAVLAQVEHVPCSNNLVVDGVRHVVVLEELRRLLKPTRVQLIYLMTGDEVRHRRLEGIGRRSSDTAARVESHSTELDPVLALPAAANGILNADRALDDVVADVLAHLRTGFPLSKLRP